MDRLHESLEMKNKVKQNDSDVRIQDVAAAADRMLWTGRLPTVDSISEALNTGDIDRVRQCLTMWKVRHNPGEAKKTRITDLPPEAQYYLMEAFEKKVAELETRLKARFSEALAQREMLAEVNERQAAQIDALLTALADAEAEIADRDKRISGLRKQISFQQQALVRAKRRSAGAEPDPALSKEP
jgi:hypothetical protein